jgi:quinolinate synthase
MDLFEQNPGTKIIAHPECEDHLLNMADFVGSTSKLLKFISDDEAKSYIVATEVGIIHQMKKAEPEKNFIPAPPEEESCSCNECPHMKLNTMEKLYLCMKNKSPEIKLDAEIAARALLPINKMLEMS